MNKTTKKPAAEAVDLNRLVRLDEEFRNACRALCDAAKETLPAGTIIEATLGRSRVRGEVVSHAEGWSTYYAGSVNVRNLKSGKIRRVIPHYDGHEVTVVSLPNHG
ncbi:MAG: hypothetical protein ACOC4K_00370 [Verrucomicrobiota bacterium]